MPGETLVLLPGMMCDARLFTPQIEVFSPSRNVVVPRLVGSATIDGLATNILDEIAAPVFDLAGLSMGGIVAMAMLRQAPARIRRLALLDTNYRADSPERRPVRDRQIADVRKGRLRQVVVEEMKPAYLARANRDNRQLLDLLITMALDLGADAFVEQSLALRDRHDHTEALRAFTGPALVLCGEEDTLCPPALHSEMAQLLRSVTLHVISKAGHIATLEMPAAVNAALMDWLTTETSPPSQSLGPCSAGSLAGNRAV